MGSAVIDALDESSRKHVLDRAVPRRVHAGETLHHAGARSERVHVVNSGLFKFVGRDGSGAETILGLAAPGDLVGDIAGLDDLPQPFDAIAATTSHVLSLDAEALFDAVVSDAAATRALLELQATRLRWVYATCLERSAGGVPARLAGRLLDLADMIGEIDSGAIALDMPLGQADLGRLAGICRESTCKALRRFRSAGVVDYRKGRLRILRPDVLEKIRCAGRA